MVGNVVEVSKSPEYVTRGNEEVLRDSRPGGKLVEMFEHGSEVVKTFELLLEDNFPGKESATIRRAIRQKWKTILQPLEKNVFAVGQDKKLIEQFPSSQEQANWINKLRTNKNILPYIVRPDGTINITKRVVNWYRYGILFNKDPQKKARLFKNNLAVLQDWRDKTLLSKFHLKTGQTRDSLIPKFYELLNN